MGSKTLQKILIADLGPIMESQVAVCGLLYTGLVTTAAALWIQSYAFEEVRRGEENILCVV